MENQNIKNFPRYEHYKDSGVDWFERIPADWDVKPIRAIFSERNERNTKLQVDFILSVTRDRGVIPYDEKGAIGNNKSENIENYKIVHPHDLVINKMNVVIGSLGLSKYHGALSHIYIVLKPMTDEVSILFYSYVFYNPLFYKSLIRYCKGIMELRESLDQTEFKKIRLPFPPLLEQTAIAQFLNHKTSQIDRAIAIKEEQIKLLNERKQIMIQEAVTKGLDPTVKMKDSGVEWIGEIPEHWETKKLRYLGTIKSGDGITNSELKESGDYEVFGGNGFMGYSDKYNVAGDKIIIGRVGAYCGNVRYINEKKWISDNALILTLRLNANFEYIKYILESFNLNKLNTSSAQPLITGSKVMNICLPLPPKNEQNEILKKIQEIDIYSNKAIKIYQNQIQALKEYKTTLINEAVTGKIKVN